MHIWPALKLARELTLDLTFNFVGDFVLRQPTCRALVFCLAALVSACGAQPVEQANSNNTTRDLTLLFTNDFESAYHPTVAYWRDDIDHIGGAAALTTLINQYRAASPTSFLFDAGDIFTGTLAKLSRGAVAFELMITMGYDAMAIGNHEFEYGWQELQQQKHRAPFPVLGANLFYKDTDIPFAQPWAIVERNGLRVGVIGVLGQNAATALIPANIAGLDVRDPTPIVRSLVRKLRPDVDLIVLLTHQGHTAPMQTDDEAQPSIQRDIQADIDLAGAVPGIDVLFGGHADAGTLTPVIHPQTGTLIMQTYGQGFHLGVLELTLDTANHRITRHRGYLATVDSDALVGDTAVQTKLDQFEARYPQIFEPVGTLSQRLNRRYNTESDLGNLFADIVREQTGASVGLMPSGALRKDLAAGTIALIDLLDVFPFEDRMASMEMTGAVLQQVIEQGLSLQRGMLQVSGMRVHYNLENPVGERITEIWVGDSPLEPTAIYKVGTVEILARGGDAYVQAREGKVLSMSGGLFSDAVMAWVRQQQQVNLPSRGRLIPIAAP